MATSRQFSVDAKTSTRGRLVAPNPPINVVASDVGLGRAFNNGAAIVSFDPATTGGAATSFTVTSSPGGFTATGSSTRLTVTGLQSNTAYTFTVTATNGYGASAASTASSSITATTVPQAPTMALLRLEVYLHLLLLLQVLLAVVLLLDLLLPHLAVVLRMEQAALLL